MNVGKEIATLRKMGVAELRGKYAEVFGGDTPESRRGLTNPHVGNGS